MRDAEESANGTDHCLWYLSADGGNQHPGGAGRDGADGNNGSLAHAASSFKES